MVIDLSSIHYRVWHFSGGWGWFIVDVAFIHPMRALFGSWQGWAIVRIMKLPFPTAHILFPEVFWDCIWITGNAALKRNSWSKQKYSVTWHTVLQHMAENMVAWVEVSSSVTPVEKYCTPFHQQCFCLSQENVRLTALQESFRQSSYPIRHKASYK